MPPSYCVILTACIAPNADALPGFSRVDPALRLREYQSAMRFWLRVPDPRIGGIVFTDNSGYPLDSLKKSIAGENPFARPVEFHSFNHPPPTPDLNYGYNEFLLINATLERSELARAHSHLIKATGRYQFPDIARLLRKLPSDFKIALDCRRCNLPGLRVPDLASIALFLCRRDFYHSDIADIPDLMVPAPPWNRRQFVEPMLFDRFFPRRHEPGLILRWPCNCEPSGIGGNGDNYTSPRKRLKNIVRSLSRVVTPFWWI